MQQTSLSAWGIIQEKIGEKQFDIFQKLAHLGPSTNNEFSVNYEIPINRVTPRMHELRHMGIVRLQCVRSCNITKFKAKVWAVVEYEQAIAQFRRYLDGQKKFHEKGELQKEFFL